MFQTVDVDDIPEVGYKSKNWHWEGEGGVQEALNLCHRQPPTSLFITSCDSISIDIRTSRSIGNSLIITRKGLISTLQHSLCPWAPRFLKESVSTTWCVYFLFFIIIHRSEPRQQNWFCVISFIVGIILGTNCEHLRTYCSRICTKKNS